MDLTILNSKAEKVISSSAVKLNKLKSYLGTEVKVPELRFLKTKNDNIIVSNLKKTLFRGQDPSSILTYIPKINLSDLVRNPGEYVKRKKRIIARVIKGQSKQFGLRIVGDLLKSEEKITIDQNVQTWDTNLKILVEENTPSLNVPEVTDLQGNPLRSYIELYIKKDGTEYKFYDGHALIKISRSKNIILTKVQGRDLTRKEFLSNGDYNISISGMIVSPYPDVYPTSEVSTLRTILEHNDLVYIKSPLLNIFEIGTMLITNYNIPQKSGYLNVQEYSFAGVFENPLEVLKFQERNMNAILSAKAEMQKIIEERNMTLKANIENIGKTSNATIKDILQKVSPQQFLQQQKWI